MRLNLKNMKFNEWKKLDMSLGNKKKSLSVLYHSFT